MGASCSGAAGCLSAEAEEGAGASFATADRGGGEGSSFHVGSASTFDRRRLVLSLVSEVGFELVMVTAFLPFRFGCGGVECRRYGGSACAMEEAGGAWVS